MLDNRSLIYDKHRGEYKIAFRIYCREFGERLIFYFHNCPIKDNSKSYDYYFRNDNL